MSARVPRPGEPIAVVVAGATVAADLAAEVVAGQPAGAATVIAGEGDVAAAIRAAAPRAVVALTDAGLDDVVVDAVGALTARVVVGGPGGRSWSDRGNAGAIDGLIQLARQLQALWIPSAPVNLAAFVGGASGAGAEAIADRAELLVSREALGEPALEAFAVALAGLELPAPLTVAVETVVSRSPQRLARDAPLLAAVLAVRAALGLSTARLTADAAPAVSAALAAGIPAVGLGATRAGDPATRALGVAQLDALLRAR